MSGVEDILAAHHAGISEEPEKALAACVKKGTTYTHSMLTKLWQSLQRSQYPSHFQLPFTTKQTYALANIKAKVPVAEQKEVLYHCFMNWIAFAKYAVSQGTAYKVPKQPDIEWLSRNVTFAVQAYRKSLQVIAQGTMAPPDKFSATNLTNYTKQGDTVPDEPKEAEASQAEALAILGEDDESSYI